MRMLTENSITENKMRSTSIERFRGQKSKGVALSEFKEDTSVTWSQIIMNIGFFIAAGTFFLFIIFSFALVTLLV